MNYNHTIGLHLRLTSTLYDLALEAQSLGFPVFQFFLVHEIIRRYVFLSDEEKKNFVALRKKHFSTLFMHSSYWVNPSTADEKLFALSKRLLKRELSIAQELEVNYLVVHGGAAKGYEKTDDDPLGIKRGLVSLAKMLNHLCKKEMGVRILLENTAFGKNAVGSDLTNFTELLSMLDFPDRIGFCLDTAHAFSYGYPLDPIHDFITLIDKTLGWEKIKLIHFNDSALRLGSKQDKHAFPGNGKIGKGPLEAILNHHVTRDIPKIIELPNEDIDSILQRVKKIQQGIL